MASSPQVKADFASGGLILFDATVAYELVATAHGLSPLSAVYAEEGNWKATLSRSFEAIFKIDYEAVFLYAIRVLDAIPPGSTTEHSLDTIHKAAEGVISHSGIVSLDLAGRVYHSTLGKELAKSFATCYTSIPAAELLAWLSIEKWDDKVGDFACGSGTLLAAAYHRKLAVAFLQGWSGTVPQLHQQFVEHDLTGFDAMPFAAHLTLVNLLLQSPTTPFKSSNIAHVPVDQHARLGSLDLLRSPSIVVQQRITGGATGARGMTISKTFKPRPLKVPRKSFDVVIMNPPFTRKQIVFEVLNKEELGRVVKRVNPELTASGGLPIPFVALGDLSLKPTGRLAVVLPSAVLGRETWQGVRTLLDRNYELNHVIINWVEGESAFSDASDIREVMLVARKRPEGEDRSEPAHRPPVLLSHLDSKISFAEARNIALTLGSIRGRADRIMLAGGASLHLRSGNRVVGETVAVDSASIHATRDNWYRWVAFRDPRLVRLGMIHSKLFASTEIPFGLDLTRLLSPLAEIADVGLFVKGVAHAGFAVIDSPPIGTRIPVLMTSDHNRLTIDLSEGKWLVRDPTLRAAERFVPGTGILLLPRKLNLCSTAKVLAVVASERMGSSMWMPCQPHQLKTSDGRVIDPTDSAKLLAMWSQSSLGALILALERQEIEGSWAEWLTAALRRRLVLDPRKLRWKAVASLLEAWTNLSDVSWELLPGQLLGANMDAKHPRAMLDEAVLSLSEAANPDIAGMRSALATDLERLGAVM